MTEAPNGRDFERRLQSIAQGLTLALLIGYGVAMVDLVKSVTRLEVVKDQTLQDIRELKQEVLSLRIQVMNAAVAASNAATAAAAAAAAAAATNPEKRGK